MVAEYITLFSQVSQCHCKPESAETLRFCLDLDPDRDDTTTSSSSSSSSSSSLSLNWARVFRGDFLLLESFDEAVEEKKLSRLLTIDPRSRFCGAGAEKNIINLRLKKIRKQEYKATIYGGFPLRANWSCISKKWQTQNVFLLSSANRCWK